MLGIYVAGDSGAYLNPAITLAFCVYRGLPFRRWPIYLVAQFLGGFVAAGVMYANYIPAIDHYAGAGVRAVPPAQGATAQIFSTYPAGDWVAKGNQFVSEFVASVLLIFVIFALKDESNMGAAAGSGNWYVVYLLLGPLPVHPFASVCLRSVYTSIGCTEMHNEQQIDHLVLTLTLQVSVGPVLPDLRYRGLLWVNKSRDHKAYKFS